MTRGPTRPDQLRDRTIADFGEQWTRYTDDGGYYGSTDIFRDVFGPLVAADELQGAAVAEIGAGTGRYVKVLLSLGVTRIVAVEPSAACSVLAGIRDPRLTILRVPGDRLPQDENLDYVFSIGVLHHIPDPKPVVAAASGALKPGGRLCIWLYGREGNALYLALALPLRAVTRRLPHSALAGLVWLLYWPLRAYTWLARLLPMPLSDIFRDVYGRLTPDKQRLVLYDQLNPAYARYYTETEARALLEEAGFVDVTSFHRHRYSWAVVGRRPITTA